jgi:hypothetical protein
MSPYFLPWSTSVPEPKHIYTALMGKHHWEGHTEVAFLPVAVQRPSFWSWMQSAASSLNAWMALKLREIPAPLRKCVPRSTYAERGCLDGGD